jgi:hypothetical protein
LSADKDSDATTLLAGIAHAVVDEGEMDPGTPLNRYKIGWRKKDQMHEIATKKTLITPMLL